MFLKGPLSFGLEILLFFLVIVVVSLSGEREKGRVELLFEWEHYSVTILSYGSGNSPSSRLITKYFYYDDDYFYHLFFIITIC